MAVPDVLQGTKWNIDLDKASAYCVLYWTDAVSFGPEYIDSLLDMSMLSVDLSWEEVCLSIRKGIEKLPTPGLTLTKMNEKAQELFRMYRSECFC